MKLDGARTLLTGAGSGIGRALAHRLYAEGAHLLLVDADEPALALVGNRLPGARTLTLDVTDRHAIRALAKAEPALDLLINNAGIAASGRFERLAPEHFDRVMDVNFRAVVDLCRAFLPHLHRAERDGRIVNISSLFGLVAPPELTAYVASKFAVNGFSQSLRHELHGTNVGVSVVHPGGVATNISPRSLVTDETEDERMERIAESERLLTMNPSKAADIITRGIARDRDRIIVGNDARAAIALERVLPVSYFRLIRRLGIMK